MTQKILAQIQAQADLGDLTGDARAGDPDSRSRSRASWSAPDPASPLRQNIALTSRDGRPRLDGYLRQAIAALGAVPVAGSERGARQPIVLREGRQQFGSAGHRLEAGDSQRGDDQRRGNDRPARWPGAPASILTFKLGRSPDGRLGPPTEEWHHEFEGSWSAPDAPGASSRWLAGSTAGVVGQRPATAKPTAPLPASTPLGTDHLPWPSGATPPAAAPPRSGRRRRSTAWPTGVDVELHALLPHLGHPSTRRPLPGPRVRPVPTRPPARATSRHSPRSAPPTRLATGAVTDLARPCPLDTIDRLPGRARRHPALHAAGGRRPPRPGDPPHRHRLRRLGGRRPAEVVMAHARRREVRLTPAPLEFTDVEDVTITGAVWSFSEPPRRVGHPGDRGRLRTTGVIRMVPVRRPGRRRDRLETITDWDDLIAVRQATTTPGPARCGCRVDAGGRPRPSAWTGRPRVRVGRGRVAQGLRRRPARHRRQSRPRGT